MKTGQDERDAWAPMDDVEGPHQPAEVRFNELVSAGKITIPELLADELFEDAFYLLRLYDQRLSFLPRDETKPDSVASDWSVFLSGELMGLLRMATLLATAASEALANELLDDINELANHEPDPLEDKWSLLYEKQQLQTEKGYRPWQSLPILVKLRNELAHYKPRNIKLLPRRPQGSLKLELFGPDGKLVHRLFQDMLTIASVYLRAVGETDRAETASKLAAGKADDLMRTLPWELPVENR